MPLMQRMYRRSRERFQAFCYWLGPTYCVLLGALILFGSFIVQLLTSIGVPFIKAFDFFRFDLANSTFIELGMWAACNGRASFSIPTRPDLNQPEQFNCPPATWGWDEERYSGITRNFFHHNLPKALILHPISCCFTFFAMVAALVTMKRQKQHFVLPIFSFLSCLFAFCSFIIDVATFVPARGKLMAPSAYSILGTTVLSTELGPAFWLSLVCFVLDIVGNGIIISGYGIWRYQRISLEQRRQSQANTRDIEMKAGSRMSRRGNYSNESTVSLGDHSPYMEKNDEDEFGSQDKTRGVAAEPASGTSSRHSLKSPSQPTLHAVNGGAASTNNVRTVNDDDSDVDVNFATDADGDDGYDSAVSAYADARSDAGRRSRDASRSQVSVIAPQPNAGTPTGEENDEERVERLERRTSSPLRNVRRKPVKQY